MARIFRSFRGRYRRLLMFVALNVPVICVILTRNLDGVDFTGLSTFYAACVMVGYYGLPVLLVASLVHLLLMVAGRLATFLSVVLMTVFVFYLLLDTFVYDLVKFHIDLFWLDYIIHDYEGLGLPESNLHTAAIGLAAVAVLEIVIWLVARRFRPRARVAALVPALIFAAFAASQVMHIAAYQRNDQRITSLTPHFPVYVPTTSHRNAVKYGDLLPIGEDAPAVADGQYRYSSLRYPLGEVDWKILPADERPNILFLLLESWRFDIMDETVSPHIAELAARSSVFENHLSSGNQTTCGIFGLFYGLHPTYWSAVKANSTVIDNPVLMDAMVDNGYACGVFAKSNFERHKISDTIFRGHQILEEFGGRSVQSFDARMNEQVIEFMKEKSDQSQPFMCFVFYKSSHFSYAYPPEHRIFEPAQNMRLAFMNEDTDPEPYLNDYRNAVHYVDTLVGDIVDYLEARGELDNTVIVLTTDHGEAFNDDRTNTWGHGTSYTQYQIRVPLILYLPGREPRRVTRRTSHIDLPGTLLRDIFGSTADPALYTNGRDLFTDDETVRPFVVGSYFNHAFVIEDDVYEIFPMYTRKYKLHNVKQKASPPSTDLLRVVLEQMNRFYAQEGGPGAGR
ncbi:sulfatase-like hydrolase/transferase [bacterium]|nr:sulfatase-like hydrolase/transferase [bacterium]